MFKPFLIALLLCCTCVYGAKEAKVFNLNDRLMSLQRFNIFSKDDYDARFVDLGMVRKRRILRMAKCVASAYAGEKIPDGFRCQTSEWCKSVMFASSVLNDWCYSDNGRIVFKSGLAVRIMRDESSNELVIAFPGVEDLNDVAVALDAMLFGDDMRQLDEATEIVRAISVAHDGKTVLVGHSLGGLLAAYATISQESNYIECYLFNPIGIPWNLFRKLDPNRIKLIKRQIITVFHPQDILRGYYSFGMSYRLDWELNVSAIKAHSIKNMISMLKALSGT